MVQHPRDLKGDLRVRQAKEIPNFGEFHDARHHPILRQGVCPIVRQLHDAVHPEGNNHLLNF